MNIVRRVARMCADMVFVNLCEVCGRRLTHAERHICLGCELSMPLTDLHLLDFNTIHQRMAPHPPIERAAAMFHYLRDDPHVKLIHATKYFDRPEVIAYLGEIYAKRLAASSDFFNGIDRIQPVPMHWFKHLRRGYNQAAVLAEAISRVTGIPLSDALSVSRHHSTQTRKNRFERWKNASGSYCADPRECALLTGMHLLIVDDVITTGSTVKACATALHASIPSVRLSVLSLGVTQQ